MLTTLLQLFWSFCQIGFTSFGGVSMLPLISSEMLSHQWMDTSEIADIVAIAEMTPGPLGLNCATFAGMQVAGLAGALAANLGVLTPTFTLCAVAAIFFERFKSSSVLQHMMVGVRPVCIGLICAVLVELAQTNYLVENVPNFSGLLIGMLALVLLLKFKLSIPKVILIGAVLGLLLGGI